MSAVVLKASIPAEEIRLGDKDTSQVSIAIENSSSTPVKYVFFVTLPETLVKAAVIDDIVFEPSALSATRKDVPQPPGAARWKIGPARGTTIEPGKTLTLTLSKIDAASAGQKTIEVEWFDWLDLQQAIGSAKLKVTVLAQDQSPRIESFEARSRVLTLKKGRKTPVGLKWKTDKDSTVELSLFGDTLLPPGQEESAPHEQLQWWEHFQYPDAPILPYRLTAKVGKRRVSRLLLIRVQEPGWNLIPECSPGSPTLLLQAGRSTAYGVFNSDKEAAVYKLDPQKSTLVGKDGFLCKVPAGKETSPGVLFQNKIWLVGGSQIDPGVYSNDLWWFDPVKKTSAPAPLQKGAFSARSCHACAVFADKLWVLGGVDANGNALRDVWCYDGSSWQGLPAPPWPDPKNALIGLCMHSAAEFKGRLWIYGGLDELGGTPQTSLWSTRDGKKWDHQQFEKGFDPEVGAPMASALCISRSQLNILATFKKGSLESSKMLTVEGYDSPHAVLKEREDVGESGWPTLRTTGHLLQPFRLTAAGVAFEGPEGDRTDYIFVASLIYRAVHQADFRSLTYYIEH